MIREKNKSLLPSLTPLIQNFESSLKKEEKKKEKRKTPENESTLTISNRLFSFTSQSGVHVFQSILSKQLRLNFIPFISVFFCRSQLQSRRKVESLRFLKSKHMHPPGPYISAKSKATAHCGRFGALGAKKHKIKDGARKAMLKAWLVFLSFFIYFPRLVAIIGGSNSKNCRSCLFTVKPGQAFPSLTN